MAEFLIELSPNVYPDIPEVVLCEGENRADAIDFAFGTRNVASDWRITGIIGDDDFEEVNFGFWTWQSSKVLRRKMEEV